MKRFRVAATSVGPETLYELQDARTGAFARVWPGFGNNCIAARLPSGDGRLFDALFEPSSLEALARNPSRWGVPLLFPWPGRIPKGRYLYQGKQYVLPLDHGKDFAIHGFANNRPWRVEDASEGEDFAQLRCSISSETHPETLEGFPFPYRLEVSWRLDAQGLTMHARVANVGEATLPFGFGAHPYFRVPLSASGRRGECRIRVPAALQWNLAKADAAGSGAGPGDGREFLEPALGGEADLRDPVPLGERLFDTVFADPQARDGWIECELYDPEAKVSALMRATDDFPVLVLFTPRDQPGICFEPWTCPPNVFNLAAQGIGQANLLELAPGRTWQAAMQLLLRAS